MVPVTNDNRLGGTPSKGTIMNKTLKTSVLAIALAGGGAIGVGSLAAASYGDEPPTIDETVGDDTIDDTTDETPGDVSDDSEPAGLQAATDGEPGEPATPTEGRRGHRGHGNSEVAAEALGITTDELHEAREAGQSLADIAAAQGVSNDVVIQALTSDAQTRIATQVAEGELTQEEADERLAGLDERITERVNQAPSEGGRRGQRGLRNSEAVAEALGVTTDDLQAARESGQSLADVATAQGVSIDAVVDAIVDGVEAHLAEEVAEGDLTQAEADERLAGAEERATEKVNAAPGERGPQGAHVGRRAPATAPADA